MKAWMQPRRTLMPLIGLLLLCGCAPIPPKHGTAINHIQAALHQGIAANKAIAKRDAQKIPASVNDALLPYQGGRLSQSRAQSNEKRFDVNVDNVPASSFFMGLVEGTQYNMIVSPKITGNLSLKLKGVTIPEVMASVRDVYGYEFTRNGNTFQVTPLSLKTRIFTLDYLNVNRSGISQTKLDAGVLDEVESTSSSNSRTKRSEHSNNQVTTRTEADFWSGLKDSIATLIGTTEGRSVVVNPQASVIVVHAYPNELRQVGKYLDELQSNLTRQVVIEARILEVELTNDYKAGIDWSLLRANQTGTDVFPSTTSITASSIFNITLGANNLKTVVHLLESQGNVQILSSPHISTVNNQKAVIKVGGDEFFVTDVSSTTSSTTNDTISQDIGLTPFFAGIALDVTPHVSMNGDIILHIHPMVTEITEDTKSITVNGRDSTLPMAKSTIRESDSIVHARSGQVIIIGGLMKNKTTETLRSTPGLSKIPYAGTLFRDTDQSSTKTELVILLRPIVTNNKVWTQGLKGASRRTAQLNQGFHFGGKPTVFGTMGETADPRYGK